MSDAYFEERREPVPIADREIFLREIEKNAAATLKTLSALDRLIGGMLAVSAAAMPVDQTAEHAQPSGAYPQMHVSESGDMAYVESTAPEPDVLPEGALNAEVIRRNLEEIYGAAA